MSTLCAQNQLFQLLPEQLGTWVSLRYATFTIKAIVRLFDFKNPKSQLLQSAFTLDLYFPAVCIRLRLTIIHLPLPNIPYDCFSIWNMKSLQSSQLNARDSMILWYWKRAIMFLPAAMQMTKAMYPLTNLSLDSLGGFRQKFAPFFPFSSSIFCHVDVNHFNSISIR